MERFTTGELTASHRINLVGGWSNTGYSSFFITDFQTSDIVDWNMWISSRSHSMTCLHSDLVKFQLWLKSTVLVEVYLPHVVKLLF